MGNEGAMWAVMRAGLNGRAYLMRMENAAMAGGADVYYCLKGGVDGWIENKRLVAWPIRATSVVRIEHLTKQQRLFNRMIRHWGGRAFICVMMQQEWFLFDHIDGLGETWCRAEWDANCVWSCIGTPNWNEFVKVLKGGKRS